MVQNNLLRKHVADTQTAEHGSHCCLANRVGFVAAKQTCKAIFYDIGQPCEASIGKSSVHTTHALYPDGGASAGPRTHILWTWLVGRSMHNLITQFSWASSMGMGATTHTCRGLHMGRITEPNGLHIA